MSEDVTIIGKQNKAISDIRDDTEKRQLLNHSVTEQVNKQDNIITKQFVITYEYKV